MRQSNLNTTAILIFANSHGVDSESKKIPESGLLFKSLNEEIVSKVKKTGLPYFIYSEQLQIGSDFGSRFTSAIQSVFSKGFDSIIAVGNDTPQLTSGTINLAYKNLREGKTIIGPSTDGGIYLLGIHRRRFDAISFRNLPWQRQDLFQETARFFLRRGMLHQLPRLTDIDSLKDIERMIHAPVSISADIFRLMLSIVRRQRYHQFYLQNTSANFEINTPFNKGSPFAST